MDMELEYVRDCIWSFWAMFNVTTTTGCWQNLVHNCVFNIETERIVCNVLIGKSTVGMTGVILQSKTDFKVVRWHQGGNLQ